MCPDAEETSKFLYGFDELINTPRDICVQVANTYVPECLYLCKKLDILVFKHVLLGAIVIKTA